MSVIRGDCPVNIVVSPDKEQTAIAAAKFIEQSATAAIKERGQFTLAVSGGSTPRRMLELLLSLIHI